MDSRTSPKVLSRSARALSNEPSLGRRTLPAAGPFSTEFVQVYKFWCYYWGLRLLTRPSGPRGGPFELLFPPLSPSAPSRSCLSLLTPLSIPAHPSPPPLPPRSPPLRELLSFSPAMPRRPCPVCFSSRRLPFAKRTLNYAADDKYLSRPLHERPTRTVIRPVLPPLARH